MNLTPDQLMMLLMVGGSLSFGVLILLSGAFYFFNAKETPVRDRLMQLRPKEDEDGRGSMVTGVKETLMEVAGPIAQNLYGNNLNFKGQVKKALRESGSNDSDWQINKTMAACVAMALFLGPVMFLCISLATKFNLIYGMGGGILGMLVGLKYPLIKLNSKAAKRKNEINYTISDSLDLMVVCMEAGLGLDSTFQRVAEEIESLAPDLSFEFKKLNKEVNAGISRTEAYHNLGTRAGVEELKALCALIVQADKLGTSVADTLRIYADDLRTKRKQKAELLASQASIKMTFPLVLFVFPPMFIILLGPAVIQVIGTFMNKPPI